MLTSEKVEQLADVLAMNVRSWERGVIERIARHIKNIGNLSPTDIIALNNAADIKGELDSIFEELAHMTGYNISELKDMYGTTLEEIHANNKPLFDYRNKTFEPISKNAKLQAIVNAYAKSSADTMLNLSMTSMLCTTNAEGQIVSLSQAYYDIIDKAVMQVVSGSGDFNSAMRDSIKALGGGGIRVNYGSGITRRLDTVVRQNLLWSAKQASTEYNAIIGSQLNCDGIEIDWHSHPRPSHEFMQGRQFHIGGDIEIDGVFYPDSTEAEERLQDYNCYHYATPIICGVSVPAYTKEELDGLNAQNAKKYTIGNKTQNGYAWSQDMRKLEAYHRTLQDTKAAAKASGDNILANQCDVKINACLKKYKEISDTTGIPMDLKRLASVQVKPQLNSIKELNKTNTSGIIKKDEMFRKKRESLSTRIPLSEKRFNELLIEAKKNGAQIVKAYPGDDYFMHLEKSHATASNIGDVIILRYDATVSEVLEETRHFMQNKTGMFEKNNPSLITLLKEIDAKTFLLENSKKYKIPRLEIEETLLQLEKYKKELEKIKEDANG